MMVVLSPKRIYGTILLVIAILLAIAGIVPDLMSVLTAGSVYYTDQPFAVNGVQRQDSVIIHLDIDRTICYDEPVPLPLLSFPISARALVNTTSNVKYFMPPAEGFASPGCRDDVRPLELESNAPPGTYFLEGVSDIQTRWSRHQVYWRTVDFVLP